MRIVRAPSVDGLAAELTRSLASARPNDPMIPVRIAVPSRGMERWLTQRLAHSLGAVGGEAGVCANVDLPFPGTVVREVLASVLGGVASDDDPWSAERLTWPVLHHLDDLPADAIHAPLRAHLRDGDGHVDRRRLPLARRIADLFDHYAMHRADMVAGWADPTTPDLDGEGRPLAPNVAWQPVLWRTLAEQLEVASPDVRFARARDALERGAIARPRDLPEQVTIFGVLSLPPLHLSLLDALAVHRPVEVFAVTPCPAWTASSGPMAAPVGEMSQGTSEQPSEVPPGSHPLLVSCGIGARHAAAALAPYADGSTWVSAELDDPATATPSPARALGVLQADLRADRARGDRHVDPVVLAPDDRSIQVHACHGAMRQVEVLREVLLGLLDDDPSLEPRDIAVLTPDIAAYEPIIRAVLGDGDRPGDDPRHGVPTLPFRVADRAVRDDNDVAQALLTVLELTTARVGASAVLDLLRSTPVATRFGLTAADVARLPEWVLGTGISWGIDADHRRELIDLEDATHTWRAGLDRLTLGAAMADDGTRLVAGVVPYDDVEGSHVDLLGRLTIATDALFRRLRDLRAPRTVAAWRDALDATVTALFDPGAGVRRDPLLTAQLAAVREALADLVDLAAGPDGRPSEVVLTLEEIRLALGEQLGSTSGPARFGSGAITFAGLEPLGNVPHRVVCLIGLDDEALPRSTHRHGFDLIAAQPRPGDPDRRVEDRQHFLDALLAARDHLVITYTGHDPRTNEVQQPAVPVSELLDVLDGTFRVADGRSGSEAGTTDRSDASDRPGGRRPRDLLLVDHPLQPHSPRYFRPPVGDESTVPQAFDQRQLAAARTAAADRAPAEAFFPADRPLPPPSADELDPVVVELADLARFLDHPVRWLLQRRIGVALGDDDLRLDDRDPTELDHLARWQLGQALLTDRPDATEQARWREHVLASGTVPVGGLGEVALDDIQQLVANLDAEVAQVEGDAWTLPVDVEVPVPDPATGGVHTTRRVVGSVELRGATVLHASVSTLKAKHRLAVWTQLLAATAQDPTLGPSGFLLGRKDDTDVKAVTLRSLAALIADGYGAPDAGGDVASAADGDAASAAGGDVASAADGDAAPAAGGDAAPTDVAVGVPTPEDVARQWLGELVELYMRGHVEPLPLLPETAHAYAAKCAKGGDVTDAIGEAAKKWESGFHAGEGEDAYVVQAFGAGSELADLAADTSFGDDAQRLWQPIITAEAKR